MAIKITDECINCGACEPECPNNAIYDAGAAWRFSDGTGLKGLIDFGDGNTLNAEETQAALSDDIYYIVPDKCTECVGFHDEPQCAAVCPVDCCLPDPNWVEPKEQLEAKVAWLDEVDPGRKRCSLKTISEKGQNSYLFCPFFFRICYFISVFLS